ncbi:MAG: hypothetical protein ACRCU1_05690 [Alsobacter sp.]
MIDLDDAGSRANQPGLTKAALKAERKAAAKARRAAWWASIKSGVAEARDFILRNLVLSLAFAALASLFAWEWFNSARGWGKLYPGLEGLAVIGAAGAVGLYFIAVHKGIEYFRQKDLGWGFLWASVAAAMFVVSLWGVWSAVASNSVAAREAAETSRKAYQELTLEIAELEDDLEINSPEIFELAINRDSRALAGLIATARGTYGMQDLDVEGACAGEKLNFNQRRYCTFANGGIDENTGRAVDGLRSEIEASQRGLKLAQEKAAELAELKTKAAGYVIDRSDEQYQAVEAFATATVSAEKINGIAFAVVSALLLFGGGVLGWWVFEQIEAKRAAAKLARDAARKTGGKA